MDFTKLTKEELINFLNLNGLKPSENLVQQALDFYIQKSNVGFLGLVLTSAVLALDRSARFPWKTEGVLTQEHILQVITEEQLLGMAKFYHVDAQTPSLRQVILRILELQGNITKIIKFISVWNIKSKMGQAWYTHKLAHEYAEAGHNCLCVDLNPDCKLTEMFYKDTLEYIYENFKDITQIMRTDTSKESVDVPEFEHGTGNIYPIPGSMNLLDFDSSIEVRMDSFTTMIAAKDFFRKVLEPIAKQKKCDVVLINVTPTSVHTARNALMGSDEIVVIVKPNFYGVQSIKSMTERLPQFKKTYQSNAKINRIVIHSRDNTPSVYDKPLEDALKADSEFTKALIQAGYSNQASGIAETIIRSTHQDNKAKTSPEVKTDKKLSPHSIVGYNAKKKSTPKKTIAPSSRAAIGLKDIDPFDVNKYKEDYQLISQFYSGPELYFTAANFILYKYGESNHKGHEGLMREISTAANKKEYIDNITCVFILEVILLYWYMHVNPAKADYDFVRGLMVKYEQAEDILINRLYKKYVDPKHDEYAHQLWIRDPPCQRPRK